MNNSKNGKKTLKTTLLFEIFWILKPQLILIRSPTYPGSNSK